MDYSLTELAFGLCMFLGGFLYGYYLCRRDEERKICMCVTD